MFKKLLMVSVIAIIGIGSNANSGSLSTFMTDAANALNNNQISSNASVAAASPSTNSSTQTQSVRKYINNRNCDQILDKKYYKICIVWMAQK